MNKEKFINAAIEIGLALASLAIILGSYWIAIRTKKVAVLPGNKVELKMTATNGE